MQIFVQHCGFKQQQDYSWKKGPGGLPGERADPEWNRLVDHFGVRGCITTEEFSLALARGDGELLLVVTALPCDPSRSDLAQRHLRAAVALVASDKEEATLRALAARALTDKDSLAREIDACLRFDDTPSGFGVDFSGLERMVTVPASLPPSLSSDGDLKEAVDSPVNLRALADELKQRCLPISHGPVVAVSRNLDPERCHRVWRLASGLVATSRWEKKAPGVAERLG